MNIADILTPLSVYPVATVTAVTGSAITQVTTTASIQKISLDSNQMKRFIKLNIDVGGTSPSFLISAVGAAVKKTV